MTIQELIEQINVEIKARDLAYYPGSDNRARYKTYQRFYLFTFLRKHKLTLVEIGELFGLDHSTVVYGLKQAGNMKKDRLYLKMTDELRQKFEQYTALNYPITRSIAHDVMQCGSFWEFRKLQEDIKNGMYSVTQ